MKYRLITILSIFAIMIILCNPGEAQAETRTAEELYASQEKFTKFTAYDGTVHELTYASELVNGNEVFKLVEKRNGEIYTTYTIPESGLNQAHFYIKRLTGTYGASVSKRIWGWPTIGEWYDGGYGFMTLSTPQDVTIPKPEPDPIEDIKMRLMITEPAYNGFKVSADKLTIWYRYGVPALMDGFGDQIFADITGATEVAGTHQLLSYVVTEDFTYRYFKVQVKDLVDGENTIRLSVSRNDVTYFDTRTVIKYSGVVDENNDGIDDRTLLPIDSGGSGLSPDGAPILPENATIFDYVKYAVDSIIYVFAQIGLALKGLIGGIGDIGKILTGFFGFMPQPFTGIIIIGMLIAIILRIFGR